MRRLLSRLIGREDEGATFLSRRVALLVVLLVVLNLFYPRTPTEMPALEEGDISSRDVIAPFTFPIRKSDEELSLEREAATERVLPVIMLREEQSREVMGAIGAFSKRVAALRKSANSVSRKIDNLREETPGLTEETAILLLSSRGTRLLEEMEGVAETIMTRGLLQDKGVLPLGRERRVSLMAKGREYTRDLEDILDMKEAANLVRERGLSIFPEREDLLKGSAELSTQFLRSNLSLNIEETSRRKEAARALVKTAKGLVLKGEMIVRAHDPVTKDVADKLRSLSLTLGPSRSASLFLSPLGRTVLFALVLALFGAYLFFLHHSILLNFSHLLLLALLAVVTLGLSSLAISFEGIYYYLIPMAFASTLTALLLNTEVALYLTVTLGMLMALYSGMQLSGPLIGLLGGAAGAFSVREVKSRTQFYRAIVWVSGTNIVAIASIELFRSSPFSFLGKGCLLGLLNGFGSIFLAMGFLPIFERLFKLTTDITLLELSDLNRPILRTLALEASGTFHHSLVVASLSEAAAQAIGAHPLLARVAAYYHDIGKLKKPEYFIENQIALKNPHDRLTPTMSSLIVSSHVKDGVEIARSEGLPREVVDAIASHHGTTLMVPFYEKAKAQGSEERPSETDFRYPGPKPQTREVAIIMLADSIEATTRSLEEPTASRVKGVIRSTTDRRLMERELDESGLTLRDLSKIGATFLPILMGVFHPRLDYPKESEDENPHREPKKKRKTYEGSSHQTGETGA